VCRSNDALVSQRLRFGVPMLRGWTGRLIFLLRLDGECPRVRWRTRLLTTYHTRLQKNHFHALHLVTSPDWGFWLFGYTYTCTGSCRARWVRKSPFCWLTSPSALLVIGSRRNNLKPPPSRHECFSTIKSQRALLLNAAGTGSTRSKP
jgi:hypothetical protein